MSSSNINSTRKCNKINTLKLTTTATTTAIATTQRNYREKTQHQKVQHQQGETKSQKRSSISATENDIHNFLG